MAKKSTKQKSRVKITQSNVRQYSTVFLVGKDKKEVTARTALKLSEDQGLTLVVVNSGVGGVYCKMLDEGKEQYKREKAAKEAKKASKKNVMQEIKLGAVNCDRHDMDYRVTNKAIPFIEKNGKVKVSVNLLRGRGKYTLKDKGAEVLQTFLNMINATEEVSWVAIFDTKPKLTGHSWTCIIKSTKPKKKSY